MFAFADVKQALIQWQERIEFAHKLLTLLNSYSPPELRNACIGKSWPCRTCPAQAAAVRWKCQSKCKCSARNSRGWDCWCDTIRASVPLFLLQRVLGLSGCDAYSRVQLRHADWGHKKAQVTLWHRCATWWGAWLRSNYPLQVSLSLESNPKSDIKIQTWAKAPLARECGDQVTLRNSFSCSFLWFSTVKLK